MMSVPCLSKWTCTLIILFLSASKVFAIQQAPHAQPIVSQKFYELLTKISTDSIAIQIDKLETFVIRNPAFASGAEWLLAKYVVNRELNRAESFFTDLPDSGFSLLIKNWMLAKIYVKMEQIKAAQEAFENAITQASPPPELILDFVFFDSHNLRLFEESDYRVKLAHDEDIFSLINAFWHYAEGEWQSAIKKINVLPRPLRNNLTILHSWAWCFHRTAQNERAWEKWERGLEAARTVGDLQFEAKFLFQLGMVAPTLQTTMFYYNSAYSIAKQIGDLYRLLQIAGNYGIVYAGQGRFNLADSLFRVAIDAGRQMQSPWRMSVWYLRLGTFLVQQDRFDEALKAYDEGAYLARKAGHTLILIRCQIREGELFRMLGQYELAHRALTAAYREAKDKNWPLFEVQADIQLAHLNLAKGRYSEARQTYKMYLETPPTIRHEIQDHSWWHIQTGRTYITEHNYIAARSEFTEAYVLADSAAYHLYTAMSLSRLAEIDLIENDLNSAHKRLDGCLTLAEETELNQVLPAIYSLRGDAFKKTGELKKALPHYKKAATLIEQIRKNLTSEASKLDYFGGKADIYDKLVDCYREIYATTGIAAYRDSLYLYMEMKRGRTLRELRADNGTEGEDVEVNFRRDKLLQASKRLQSQQRYLRDYGALFTKQEMDSVMVQVQTARLSLIAQRLRFTQGTNLDSDSLLAKIPALEKLNAILLANESALIFYHFSEHPFALAITGDTTQVVSLPTTIASMDSSLQSLLNPFHRVTKNASEAVFKAGLAHELYRTLVAPIEDAVQLPANVLIAPDAHLANLPFGLLLTAKPERSEYIPSDSAPYSDDFLIQRYSIAYIPNASFLFEADFVPVSPNVIVFADPFDEAPSMDRKMLTSLRTGLNFTPLIFSSREADGIKAIHPNTEIFRWQEATKEQLFREAPKYDIIHFATHAFVDTTHDAFSGLVLSTSDDTEDDGILMGYEIADLKLNADLVALSACETGRGKVMPGEGVLGLPRLFLGAGANTVLMTHWKIDDKFAADLMINFYDYYLKQGMPKAKALTAAKRSVLNTPRKSGEVNYHHPLFWASFAMYGEPGYELIEEDRRLLFLAIIMLTALIAMVVFISLRRSRSEG